MGEKENNNNLNGSPVTRWLRNSILSATMADLPAMMTASGWRKDEKGDYVLDLQNYPHVILLRDNLAAEGVGVILGDFGLPALYGLYNLGIRGLGKTGNNWARAKLISKEMNDIVGEGLQYFGKVKYYGPTMGKTTAAKTNPDLADFDDVTREAKNSLAKELNIPTRVLQSDPKYALAYLEMLERELNKWRRNPLNTNKTLVISKKGLADKNIYNNEPSIPDRQTFVQRLRNRGETDDANSNDWYNMLLKQNPNLKIDNRFVSEIEYNPHYIESQSSKLPYLKKGSGIHIKKKNRGKFTEYCGGEVTDECILRAKKSKNPKLRKRATFAANSRRWSKKHLLGGIVEAGSSFIPIVGTYQSYQDWKKDPSVSNALWTVASGVGDALQLTGIGYGLGTAIKGLKAANTARKTVKAFNTARLATRQANQVKMLEYGEPGKRAFQGWKAAGVNLRNSNQKLDEANKHFKNAVKGFGVSLLDPAIDVSESIFK